MKSMIVESLDKVLARLQTEGRDEPCAPNKHFYTVEEGSKYLKVIRNMGTREAPSNSRTVFFFADKVTGDVFKPAGWKAPAKGVRFNLLDPESLARMTEKADRHGSFLYMR